MSSCRLYLITPPVIADLGAFARDLEAALAAGDVACLQIRLKDAQGNKVADDVVRAAVRKLMPICHAHEVAVILNDRPDLAAELGCDGVHIGPDDPSYAEARRIMGPNATVGVTARDSRHVAMELAEQGADYVAFGAFFPSSTKDAATRAEPELIEVWSETTNVPCVAIGGITVDNCDALVAAGADFLAVSAGVWSHADGAAAAVRAFNAIFDRPEPRSEA